MAGATVTRENIPPKETVAMKYRRYSKEFKDEACKMASDPACGPSQAAQRLGIPEATVRLWLKERGLILPRVAHVPETDDPALLKSQIRELQKKLRDAEIDNEILKKATAYFAKKQS
jgi:transposase